jgi:hypothetical protein
MQFWRSAVHAAPTESARVYESWRIRSELCQDDGLHGKWPMKLLESKFELSKSNSSNVTRL